MITDKPTERARRLLALHNQGRSGKLGDNFTCPACRQEFDVYDAEDARLYNLHPERCEPLRADVENEG